MADEKFFEATQSRLEKAKREGDVARSQDLCALVAFAAAAAAMTVIIPLLAGAFQAAIFSAAHGARWLDAAICIMVLALVPAAAAAIGALACAMLQGGLALHWPQVKLERLSPFENGKRILSRETLSAIFRSLLAFGCAAAAIFPALRDVAAGAVRGAGIFGLSHGAWRASLLAAAAACLAASAFALGDYRSQLNRRRQRLRMSHDEMRRDRKENDGDPLARSRRRSLHRMLARSSLNRVKDAAFVVCNPEHIAVALEYRPPVTPVPRVLVRAKDETAARVRALAVEWRIPLVHNAPLARMLYRLPVEHHIPPECYAAVAEIVARLQTAAGVA